VTSARNSPRSTLWVPPAARHEMANVRASDEMVRAACALAGRIPGLPPIPPSAGAGARLPPVLSSKCVRTVGRSKNVHGTLTYASRLDGNWVFT
jgi:hypothetical protein